MIKYILILAVSCFAGFNVDYLKIDSTLNYRGSIVTFKSRAELDSARVRVAGKPVTLIATDTIKGNIRIDSNMTLEVSGKGYFKKLIASDSLVITGTLGNVPNRKWIDSGIPVKFASGAVSSVRPEWWGAKNNDDRLGNGVDCSNAFQLAQNCARDSHLPIKLMGGGYQSSISSGCYRITKTILCYAPMFGESMSWRAGTVITCYINDGTAMFSYQLTSSSSVQLGNIYIAGATTSHYPRPYPIGVDTVAAIDPLNFTALKLRGSVNDTSPNTNQAFDNLRIRYAKVGIDIYGWIGNWNNITIQGCDDAVLASAVNAQNWTLRIEECKRGVTIDGEKTTSGMVFNNLLCEIIYEYGVKINRTNSVTFTSPYFELVYGPSMIIGDEIECRGVVVTGLKLNTDYLYPNRYAIEVDSADGLTFLGGYTRVGPSSLSNRALKVTTNTKNFKSTLLTYNGWMTGSVDNFNQRINIWPNGRFDYWLRGWNSVGVSGVTIERDTVEVKSGFQSLKVRGTVDTIVKYVYFKISDSCYLQKIKGKKITIGAWMKMPAFDSAITKIKPNIQVLDGASLNVESSTGMSEVGEWNFHYIECQVSATPLYFQLRIYLDRSGYVPNYTTTNSLLYVDNICVLDGWGCFKDAENGNYTDANLLGLGIGSTYQMVGDTIPVGHDQEWQKGDRIVYRTLAGRSSVGVICTTSGVLGVSSALWTEYGLVNKLFTSAKEFDSTRTNHDQDAILLQSDSLLAGLNTHGASIGFGTSGSNRRSAAIVTVQTGSDADNVGFDFFGHTSSAFGDSLSNLMQINHLKKLTVYGKITTPDTTPTTSPTTGALTAVSAGFHHVWVDSLHGEKTKLSDSTGLVVKAANGYYYKIKINALGLITADSTGQN